MTIFGALGVAGSGLDVDRKWLDAVSDNISNANDTTSTSEQVYKQAYVRASEITSGDGGVSVAGVVRSSENGIVTYDPTNPLADADGNVRRADVDLSSQMTQLIMAQRGYQANAAVVDRAKEAYEAALQIGK